MVGWYTEEVPSHVVHAVPWVLKQAVAAENAQRGSDDLFSKSLVMSDQGDPFASLLYPGSPYDIRIVM